MVLRGLEEQLAVEIPKVTTPRLVIVRRKSQEVAPEDVRVMDPPEVEEDAPFQRNGSAGSVGN